PVLEHRRPDGAVVEGEGAGVRRGPAGRVVVVRTALADRLGGHVPRLQVSPVEGPTGPGQAGAGLEVDPVERADGQALVWRPVPRGSTECPDPRPVEPMEGVPHALAPIAPLGPVFHLTPTALQQADPGLAGLELFRHGDPGGAGSHDAQVALDELAVGGFSRMRQHHGSPFVVRLVPHRQQGRLLSSYRRWISLTAVRPYGARQAAARRPSWTRPRQ